MAEISAPAHRGLRFSNFELDPHSGELRKAGVLVGLQEQSLKVLVELLERPGELVTREQLRQRLWPDGTSVDFDHGLNAVINRLRETLGDSANSPRFIQTVPRRGYRFIAPVERGIGGHALREQAADERGHIRPESADPDSHGRERGTRRYHSVLRWVVVLALAVGSALALYEARRRIWLRPETSSVATRPDPLTLAVFPFQTLGAERNEDYLGLGMADALITRLSRIERITVRPTIAVSRYTNRAHDPFAAARDLAVGSVLDGNIQRFGDRVRVTVQLVQVQDGRLLWGGTFDERFIDVFSIQDRVSARVAEVLLVALRGDELQRLTRRETQIGAAYEAYLKGRYLANERTPETLAAALASFVEAIDRDSRYALAHAGLADAFALLGVYGALPTIEAFPKAKAAAVAALNIDDTIGEAHTTLAFVKTLYEWDWAGGEAEFKRAIQLSPNYSTAHHWYAINLMSTGRAREAIAEVQRAHFLDPLSPIVSTDVGEIFFWAGEYERAITQAQKTLEMHPHYYLAHGLLGWAHAHKGEYSQALAEFRKVRAGTDDDGTRVGIGYVAALTNNRVEALQILKELEELGKTRYVSPHHLAVLYAAVGNREQAFESLERAYENRVAQLNWLKIDPRFRTLRSDPRFKSLLRRLSLES